MATIPKNHRFPSEIVIPRGCDFFDFCGFDTPNPKIFQNPHKAVILSEAPRRSIA
jgi:hypothetical protein